MKGLLFNADQALAVWEGRQSVVRRPMKSQPTSIFEDPVCIYGKGHSGEGWYAYEAEYGDEGTEFLNCPYSPGEVVYMQEPWCPVVDPFVGGAAAGVGYSDKTWLGIQEPVGKFKDGWTCFNWEKPDVWKFNSPVTMPQWASRLHLKLTVRPEKLQDITKEEAALEGCTNGSPLYALSLYDFKELWDAIYKKFPWSSNPWIWRYGLEEVWRR